MEEIEKILRTTKIIAVVGLSDKSDRDSYAVANYLQNAGYKIIPVNPNIKEWKGIKAYTSLADIPESIVIDVLDIFRRSEFVDEIVDQVIKMKNKPKVIWMQLGIENENAAKKAKAAGIIIIQNKCMKMEHEKYF